jgi:acyl-CoA thioesterase FadM
MAEWNETWRGIVKAWECDIFDHLTVAYYFDHLEDASALALRRLGEAATKARTRRLYVRFLREFRAGDALHVASAPIASQAGALTLGHKILDSATGELTTTAEEVLTGAPPVADLADWDGPAREERAMPAQPLRWVPSGRGLVKPAELSSAGEMSWQHLVHRFSGASLHACLAFGMTPRYLREENRGFSTFELDLALAALPRVDDPVLVETALLQIGRSSIRLLHRMRHAGSGAEIATLGQYGVHFDMAARRPAPLPPALREAALRLVPDHAREN